MTYEGSIISVCTSVATDVGAEEKSLLQRCVYVRDQLGLDKYKSTRGTYTATSGPHIKISSKTLKECYVLPAADGGHIEDLFTKLAKFMHALKLENTKPPRTDFTCLSRSERNKVFVDVDCRVCKNGEPVGERRHFSFTKSLNFIISAVNRVFNKRIVDEGIYMTTGGSSCGYHLFFNCLTYGSGSGVTNSALMDAIDDVFRRERLTNAAVDRGCTQMPLPTASHSNSTRYATPYVLRHYGGEWKKEKLNWVDMDADTLKCLSSIAFPARYDTTSLSSPPVVPENAVISATTTTTTSVQVTEAIVVANGKRKRCDETTTECNEDELPELPANKKPCPAPVTACKTRYTEPSMDDSFTEPTTPPTPPPPPPHPEVPTTTLWATPRAVNEYDNDTASVFSTQTEATDMNSFVCPRAPDSVAAAAATPVSFDRRRQQMRNGRMSDGRVGSRVNDTTPSAVFTNVLGSQPYDCENDKTSPFADKQYKAALLCAEEAEATASKTRLALENQGHRRRRVYVIPGTSSNAPREYKLLVQLVNVNRSVYGGDLASRRDWTDILVSYFDQHLCNPVLLEIIKFVFSEKGVEATFDRVELEEIKCSLVHLMASFRGQSGEEAARFPPEPTPNAVDDERQQWEEREARPHKARLVGALIRVCTHLFGMVTAVVSDLTRIQRAMETRDLSLLNRTVVNERGTGGDREDYRDCSANVVDDDEDLDCSASMRGGDSSSTAAADYQTTNAKCSTNYRLLASLIVHEQANLSDQACYAFLYYYHHFPSIIIDRLLDEVHHDGLMVTAFVKYFMMYDHHGKPLTLQEIFEGFNDAVISLSGPDNFILVRRKNQRRCETKKNTSKSGSNKRTNNNQNPRYNNNNNNRNNRSRWQDRDEDDAVETAGGEEDAAGGEGDDSNNTNGSGNSVTTEEIQKLLSGTERKRRRLMCNSYDGPPSERPRYEWKDKHLWQAVINYYLRPVVMHEDRLVFANDGYNTFEDDAVESCVAHVMTKCRNTKADVTTAFKDARTVWRMHHSSQFLYESDLTSDTVGCCFHINIALKMYEMFCGGCVTRMKRVHRNYLIDRSRFNMTVYDVVAECRTATVNLTSAIDRSYVNLLLRQPVVPPFLEDAETRHLFMSEAEMNRGSFCCLTVMDYRRALNLFERSNCRSKPELDTCDYVENFLDDLYTSEVAAERPPNATAEWRTRVLYTFYSLYLYEVVFAMRHAYARRENCYVSVERLSYELDVHELLNLFFGEASMRRVQGLDEELEHRIRQTVEGFENANGAGGRNSSDRAASSSSSLSDNRFFDVRQVLAAEIPDKMLRMKTLFGQFGFDVMQDVRAAEPSPTCLSATRDDDNDSFSDTTDRRVEEDDDREESGRFEKKWDDEAKFENEFYASENWPDAVCERVLDTGITGKTYKRTPMLSAGASREGVFLRETVRSVMRLELKRHIDHDRLGKLMTENGCNALYDVTKRLPMRLKLLAFILTTHTIKLKTKRLASDFVEETYCKADDSFTNEQQSSSSSSSLPPENVWYRTTETLLNDRRGLLSHARWLAERRFPNSFFVGLDPASVYDVLYEYMKDNKDLYPAFKRYADNEDTKPAAAHLCTAMMYVLIMSAYDQEHVDLYLRVFLAVEWPGQWAKTIFVWKSNSNAGKSYLFDSIIKRACANSTCINDPKGGKENAPEKAEYVKNFVLFANEFSQANSNELKKIVSESTFKFRMNYGNMMNEAYATGKIMFNCNVLPPTSDEAAINRLTLFNIPFWFSRRQRISDAMLNWICGLGGGASSGASSRWEIAYRYELPSLLTEAERNFLESHGETKNETDLFNGYAAVRPSLYTTESNKALSPLFLAQNKTSRVYALSSPPTDHIVYGLVNITNHFSWLRFFKRLDTPVDFSTLPASSEAVRSEWLSLTLPYQEWKQLTGAKVDPTSRVAAETINKSLQAFATKKNVNYFGIRQFFETDFASSREAIKDEYYVRFNTKILCD